MLKRPSLTAPITLGVVLIVLVVLLAVIWIVGSLMAAGNVAILATGTVLLAAVLGGVIAYLALTVKAVNLNRRQSNFIDAVTHELKSPIASLKLYLQTMARRSVDQRQQQDFHRIMLEDVERLDLLINHLLDAAHIERRVEQTTEDDVRLDRLLEQCRSAICIRYRVPVETVEIDSPPVTVRSQLVQLEILFRNLIDNAVKYGGSPPRVLVRVTPDADQGVTVSIIDNGAGIPADQRRTVFGRFIRLGNELERSTPGTGLGLYLVREVIKAIGGSIRVADREPGDGTEFEVRLRGVIPETALAG